MQNFEILHTDVINKEQLLSYQMQILLISICDYKTQYLHLNSNASTLCNIGIILSDLGSLYSGFLPTFLLHLSKSFVDSLE
jgi:hypothetical protein